MAGWALTAGLEDDTLGGQSGALWEGDHLCSHCPPPPAQEEETEVQEGRWVSATQLSRQL